MRQFNGAQADGRAALSKPFPACLERTINVRNPTLAKRHQCFVCLDILINKQYMLISMKHRPSILTASPIQIFVNQAEIGG